MNPYFTEMLMTNILLVYYAKLYLCTAQHCLIRTELTGRGITTKKSNPCNIYHFTQHCNVVGYNAEQ